MSFDTQWREALAEMKKLGVTSVSLTQAEQIALTFFNAGIEYQKTRSDVKPQEPNPVDAAPRVFKHGNKTVFTTAKRTKM